MLPSWTKTQSKSDLQRMMRHAGFDDVSGTKVQLLERYATGKPFVLFKIDARECVQRALAVVTARAEREDEGAPCRPGARRQE